MKSIFHYRRENNEEENININANKHFWLINSIFFLFLISGAGTLYYYKYHKAQECNEDDYNDRNEYNKAKNKLAYNRIKQEFPGPIQYSSAITRRSQIFL